MKQPFLTEDTDLYSYYFVIFVYLVVPIASFGFNHSGIQSDYLPVGWMELIGVMATAEKRG